MAAYTPFYVLWVDGSGGGTPVVAAALNTMEAGIAAAIPAPAAPITSGVLSYGGATYSTALLVDANVSPTAALALSKLATGAASRGQMIVMGSTAFAPSNTLQASADGIIPLIVKQNSATQSADLFEAVDSTGTVLFSVQKDGTVIYKDGSSSTNAGGSNLDFATTSTSSGAISATTAGTAVAVLTGASQAYTATRNQIEFWCSSATVVTGGLVHILLKRGATLVGEQIVTMAAGTTLPFPFFSVYDTPTASTFAYSINAYVSAGSVNFIAGAGGSGVAMPMTMRVSRA